MGWWQGPLVILPCIIGGLLVAYLLSYLIITRVLKEPFRKPFSKKRKITKQQLKEQVKRKEAAVVEEPLESVAPNLVTEVRNNRRIVTEPWAGKLLPFQTHVWDTSQGEVYKLPGNLREDLTQAYVDMRLANSIVWLSMELGRRSHNLDENYMKLCANIAVRLDRITPLLKWSGD